MVGAGALLTPGTKVPKGSLILGSPGKVKRALTEQERAFLITSAQNYARLAETYRRQTDS